MGLIPGVRSRPLRAGAEEHPHIPRQSSAAQQGGSAAGQQGGSAAAQQGGSAAAQQGGSAAGYRGGSAAGQQDGFQRFQLRPELLRAVLDAGFTAPRPIQSEGLPPALAGRDVLGLAQTGTGKTAAFVLPILQRLLGTKGQALRALVLTPTRELAAQVHAEFERLARHTQLTSAVVFGGVPIPRQERALKRRPDVVVACPGRLLDLLGRGTLRLDRVEVLVLDEADHMFDMGFLPDVRRILAALPERRQNLLFSATMPPEIRKLADRVLRKPAVVELAHSKPAETIDHVLYSVAEAQKVLALERLLADRSFRSAIVFMRTKRRTRRLQQQLDRAGHRVVALQGNMSQSQRDRAMRGFREGRFDVLVATDIAARGLDVAGVSHVVNFDVPSTPDAYTHRVGRTGRSGLSGTAFTFGTSADAAALRAIERQLGYPIPRRSLDELGLAGARPQRAEARTQGSGARPPRAGARPPRAAEQAASKRPRANQRRSKPNRAKQGARPGPRRAPATRRHPERSVPAELPSFGQGVHDAPVERPA